MIFPHIPNGFILADFWYLHFQDVSLNLRRGQNQRIHPVYITCLKQMIITRNHTALQLIWACQKTAGQKSSGCKMESGKKVMSSELR